MRQEGSKCAREISLSNSPVEQHMGKSSPGGATELSPALQRREKWEKRLKSRGPAAKAPSEPEGEAHGTEFSRPRFGASFGAAHPHTKVSRFSPHRCAILRIAKFDSQAVEARYRQPASHHFHSSESSQHISRNKKKEHQWQNKEQ